MSCTAFAPVYPAQRRRGTPIPRSHHQSDSAARAMSPITSTTAAGIPPVAMASSVLSASMSPSAPPRINPSGKSHRNRRYASPPARTLAATRRFRSAARNGTASDTCRVLALLALATAAVNLARARSSVPVSGASSRSTYSSDPAELDPTAGSVLTSVGSASAALLLRRSTKKIAASAAEVMSEEMTSDASG